MIIYGIKNCDTMKKAFTWLDAHKIPYAFHDYKKQGISAQKIKEWAKQIPVIDLINTKGTTFKKLSEDDIISIADDAKAIQLMIQHSSMIKRPLVETPEGILTGFKAESWEKKFL